MGVQVAFHTRDLGVDVEWGPWRNPVQQSRIKSFTAAMTRVRMLNLPLRFKMSMIRALYPLVIYGSEVIRWEDADYFVVTASHCNHGSGSRTPPRLPWHRAGPGRPHA
eukprot:5878324-Amphidinium_carterae.1